MRGYLKKCKVASKKRQLGGSSGANQFKVTKGGGRKGRNKWGNSKILNKYDYVCSNRLRLMWNREYARREIQAMQVRP